MIPVRRMGRPGLSAFSNFLVRSTIFSDSGTISRRRWSVQHVRKLTTQQHAFAGGSTGGEYDGNSPTENLESASVEKVRIHTSMPQVPDVPDNDVILPRKSPFLPTSATTLSNWMKNAKFRQPAQAKLIKVSIVGLPNVGKSTLTNALVGWRVASVSSKIHTTRRTTMACSTDHESSTQIVLLDTPGLIDVEQARKHHVARTLLVDPHKSLQQADLVAVVVDVTKHWQCERLPHLMLDMLFRNPNVPCTLVLNKTDAVKHKRHLLETAFRLANGFVDSKPIERHVPLLGFSPREKHRLQLEQRYLGEDTFFSQLSTKNFVDVDNALVNEIEQYQMFNRETDSQSMRAMLDNRVGWPRFRRIFMVSALEQDGIEQFRNFLIQNARRQPWLFDPHIVTDQTPSEIVKLAVREKMLEHVRHKIPYQTDVRIKEWFVDHNKGTIRCCVELIAPRSGAVRYFIGPGAARVRQIAHEAGQELMNAFRCEVLLKVVVTHDLSKIPKD